jgi:hypothetical protein
VKLPSPSGANRKIRVSVRRAGIRRRSSLYVYVALPYLFSSSRSWVLMEMVAVDIPPHRIPINTADLYTPRLRGSFEADADEDCGAEGGGGAVEEGGGGGC